MVYLISPFEGPKTPWSKKHLAILMIHANLQDLNDITWVINSTCDKELRNLAKEGKRRAPSGYWLRWKPYCIYQAWQKMQEDSDPIINMVHELDIEKDKDARHVFKKVKYLEKDKAAAKKKEEKKERKEQRRRGC